MIEEKVHRIGGRMGGGRTAGAGAGPGVAVEEKSLLPAPLFLLLRSLRGAGQGCTGWFRRELSDFRCLSFQVAWDAGERLGVDGSL